MKQINKLFLNASLFSVLSLLLFIPMLAITFSGFTQKAAENSEVLSAQDENIQEGRELNTEIPAELEEIIRKVELQMAKEAAESAGSGDINFYEAPSDTGQQD